MDGVCSMSGAEERCIQGNLRERDQWEDPSIDERIILTWIFRKWDVGPWTGSIWLKIGTAGGHVPMH